MNSGKEKDSLLDRDASVRINHGSYDERMLLLQMHAHVRNAFGIYDEMHEMHAVCMAKDLVMYTYQCCYPIMLSRWIGAGQSSYRVGDGENKLWSIRESSGPGRS